MSITIAGKLITPTVFPDKTTQVWKLTPEQLACDEVVWVYEGDHELVSILQIGALLTELRRSNDLTLICDQFPYARQDKHISNDTTFGLTPFLYCIASYYDVIKTFDIHNEMPFEWYCDIKNTLPKDVIVQIVEDEKIDIIIYPDKGAAARYSHLSDKEFVCADKVRDQLTGEITGIKVDKPEEVKGKNALIVDDICDGGRTFIELAKSLKESNNFPKSLMLYTSHGIYSKGTQCLLDAGFNKLFTKDGYV